MVCESGTKICTNQGLALSVENGEFTTFSVSWSKNSTRNEEPGQVLHARSGLTWFPKPRQDLHFQLLLVANGYILAPEGLRRDIAQGGAEQTK